MKSSAILLMLLLGPPAPAGEPAAGARLDPAQRYSGSKTDPVEHEVDFSVVVTPPYGCRELRIWLPLPTSDALQQVSAGRLSSFPERVEPEIGVEPVYGNRFAHFAFRNPRGAQVIRHRFRVKLWNVHWGLSEENVHAVREWPASFAPYRTADAHASREELESLVRSLVPQAGNPANDFLKLVEWVEGNLSYDHEQASLRADPLHALTLRRGHCSDYHGLCSSMTRTLGYPARVTYGLALYPKNSPSHCKVESFLPPHGWVSFDVSETQRLVARIQQDDTLSAGEREELAAAARRRMREGFRENSWLLLTRGTNYDLVPPAKGGKVPVVRTIYAEADGEPLPDPDPANPEQREFAWMTVHHYTADRPITQFSDYSRLQRPSAPPPGAP